MSRFVVGLTGGIGSGKSAAADCFRRLGVTVVDADQGSRAVVEPGSPALAAIAARFGPEILRADGTLDRAALRARVFADPAERHWLEELLHPLIRRWIAERLAEASGPYAVLESPLLLEMGAPPAVDRVVVVDVPEEVQVERACARDGADPAQIKAILAAQMPRAERLARADDVLDNRGSLDELCRQVAELHRRYLALAREKNAP